MMRIVRADNPAVRRRPSRAGPDEETVRSIISDVRDGGDAALRAYDEKFGGAPGPLRMEAEDIRKAYRMVEPGVLDAIRVMAGKVRDTEEALLRALSGVDGPPGIARTFPAIPSVGCYVPGGGARYPSSAVMSVVPASVAGVKRIVVVSPPAPEGIEAATMVAADHCGAHEIYRTGGAQAVAALAYGTESIGGVHKIVGPGGPAVTRAKRLVSVDVQVDMEAGPTELGIMADSGADPHLVALDLISQAEHSDDTFCFLLTTSQDLAREVARMVESKLEVIQRAGIVRASLEGNGFIAVCDDTAQMADLAELLAPEHLQVMTRHPDRDAATLTSPGLVLLGRDTPSAASDYLLGSNHILPTGGQGRFRGQLSVLDYIKVNTTVQAAAGDLAGILPHMKRMTDSEGLPNHYEAVRGRVP